MWFDEIDTNMCLCGKQCAKGFPKCHQCLPTRNELLLNCELLNDDYEGIHGQFQKTDIDYKEHIKTNCALTASMIQKEFGFSIGQLEVDNTIKTTKDLFKKLQATNFVQIELRSERQVGLHIMTIIGHYIVHSFLGEFPLQIKKIDKKWIKAHEEKNWSEICEYKFESDEYHLVYYFPWKGYNYREMLTGVQEVGLHQFSKRLQLLTGIKRKF